MTRAILALLCLFLAGCEGDCDCDVPPPPPPPPPRLTSILVEVYDPQTNLVWENVSVRVVEAWQEWSSCLCVSPTVDYLLTDSGGRVLFDEYWLADAQVGFLEDDLGRAVLSPLLDEDDAVVLLEVTAVGFTPVFVEVPLNWEQPDVFVEVAFF